MSELPTERKLDTVIDAIRSQHLAGAYTEKLRLLADTNRGYEVHPALERYAYDTITDSMHADEISAYSDPGSDEVRTIQETLESYSADEVQDLYYAYFDERGVHDAVFDGWEPMIGAYIGTIYQQELDNETMRITNAGFSEEDLQHLEGLRRSYWAFRELDLSPIGYWRDYSNREYNGTPLVQDNRMSLSDSASVVLGAAQINVGEDDLFSEDYTLSDVLNIDAKAMRELLEARFFATFGEAESEQYRHRFRVLNIGKSGGFNVTESDEELYVMHPVEDIEHNDGLLYQGGAAYDGQPKLAIWMNAPDRDKSTVLKRPEDHEKEDFDLNKISIGMEINREGGKYQFLVPLLESVELSDGREFTQPAGLDPYTTIQSGFVTSQKGQEFMHTAYALTQAVFDILDEKKVDDMPTNNFIDLALELMSEDSAGKLRRVLSGLAVDTLRDGADKFRAATELHLLDALRYEPLGRQITIRQGRQDKTVLMHAKAPVKIGSRKAEGLFVESGQGIYNHKTGLHEDTFIYMERLADENLNRRPVSRKYTITINEIDEVNLFVHQKKGILPKPAGDADWAVMQAIAEWL